MMSSRIPGVHANPNGRSKVVSQQQSTPASAITSRDHVSIFVHGLHLLGLAQRDDWPEVTEPIFAAKTAQQHLQHRVKAVEWSLYRLFQLYDADETKDKLDPFFPPTSPLQSLNLRAALYRCLTELKRSGTLGSQIQLRKTMLDECKGDKFYEVIASFAMIVLRRVTKLQYPEKHTPSDQISPLVLAHRHVLQGNLSKRRALSSQHEKFLSRIQEVKADLDDRQREIEAYHVQISPPQANFLTNLVYTNWIGNRVWADLIVHGPPVERFIEGVGHLQETLHTTTNSGVDPVQTLDAKIKLHRSRLSEWKVIAKDLQSKRESSNSTAEPIPASSLSRPRQERRFAKHDHLHVNSKELDTQGKLTISPMYQELLDSMQRDLADEPTASFGAPLATPRVVTSTSSELMAEAETASGGAAAAAAAPSAVVTRDQCEVDHVWQPIKRQSSQDKFAQSNMVENIKPTGRLEQSVQQLESLTIEASPRLSSSPVSSIPDDLTSSTWIHKPESSIVTARPASPTKLNRSTTPEVGSDEDDIDPPVSPTKEWMSLVDRTRASMSGFEHYKQPLGLQSDTNSGQLRTVEQTLAHVPEGVATSTVMQPAQRHAHSPESDIPPEHTVEFGSTTLLERTRQSMSLLSSTTTTTTTHRPKRTSHLPPSTSKRLSLFPVNQFETPGKPRNRRTSEFGPSSESSTPREKLFEEEADYASVFKSRPKLAMSPVASDPEDDDEGEEDASMVGFDSILEQDMQGLELIGSEDEDEDDDIQATPRAGASGYTYGRGYR